MGERRAKKGRSHTSCRPRLTIYGLSTAPRARAPGPRTGGGPAGRPAKSRTQRGAEGHLEQARAPRRPQRGRRGGGAQGRTPDHHKRPGEAKQGPAGGPAQEQPGGGGGKPGEARHSPRAGSARARSPEGRPRGDPAGPRAGDSRPGAEEGRPTGSPHRSGWDGQARRGQRAGAERASAHNPRAGEPGGTAGARRRQGRRPQGAMRRTGAAKRARARRPPRDPRRGRGPGARGDRRLAEQARTPFVARAPKGTEPGDPGGALVAPGPGAHAPRGSTRAREAERSARGPAGPLSGAGASRAKPARSTAERHIRRAPST